MLTPQQYADQCLIVIGDGGEADEVLAQRRLRAGGRLLHIQTQADSQVEVLTNGFEDVANAWQPPVGEISSFGRRLGAKPLRRRTKTGPDAVELKDNLLKIFKHDGALRHVQMLDSFLDVQMEVSGQVVLNPDLETARMFPVEVFEEDMKAFGTLSWGHLLPSFALAFCWASLRWWVQLFFEAQADSARSPWWRPVLCAVEVLVLSHLTAYEMFANCMTGSHSLLWTELLGSAIGAAAIAAAFLYDDRLHPVLVVGVAFGPLLFGALMPLYHLTRRQHTGRRFWPSLAWALTYIFTCNTLPLVAVNVGWTYGVLIANGDIFWAGLYLPISTIVIEQGALALVRHTYHSLVWRARKDGDFSVAGDQLYIVASTMTLSCHSFSEGTRLMVVFATAATLGTYSWVNTAVFTFLVNILVRLGWGRFALFRTLRCFFGKHLATRVAGPSSWDMLHEEMKVYGGYTRHIAILSIILVRAVFWREGNMESSRWPAYNLSALCVLLTMMVTEVLEDVVVLWELLPAAPIPIEVLARDTRRNAPCPLSVIAVERRRHPKFPIPSLSEEGKWSSVLATSQPPAFSPCPSVGRAESSRWAQVRSLDRRRVFPAQVLHGLRVLRFSEQLGSAVLMTLFNLIQLSLLLGGSFMLGLSEYCVQSPERLFLWEVPMSCE